jgi:hypothetical protein
MVSRSSFSEICPRNTEVDDRVWEVVPEHDHQGDNSPQAYSDRYQEERRSVVGHALGPALTWTFQCYCSKYSWGGDLKSREIWASLNVSMNQ